MTIQGVYVGNDVTAFTQAQTWSGNAFTANTLFIGQANWADFDGGFDYQNSLWSGNSATKLWSIPLIVNGASLANAAQGNYDSHYLAAAQKLVAADPSGPIYVRTGWEFNGSWEPWASAGNQQDYISAYRQLVDTFRTVSDRFVFTWTPNIGAQGGDPSVSYPGDKYVDIIGMDFYYDTQWDSKNGDAAWNYDVNEPYGLAWLESFAAQHGKPTAYPEWGVNSDTSSSFIADASSWFSSHNVVYESYWNSNAAFSGQLSGSQYPDASSSFLADVAHSSLSSTQPLVETDTYNLQGTKVYARFYLANTLVREEGYDASGARTLVITDSGTQRVASHYDPSGSLIEQDIYDVSGALLSTTTTNASVTNRVDYNSDGSTFHQSLNAAGLPISQSGYDAQGHSLWANKYDSVGALTEQDGYDVNGKKTLEIDHRADGTTVDQTWTPNGLLTSQSGYDAQGHELWLNSYDVNGSLLRQDGFSSSGVRSIEILHNADGGTFQQDWTSAGVLASQSGYDIQHHELWSNSYGTGGDLTKQDGFAINGVKTTEIDHSANGHSLYIYWSEAGVFLSETGYSADHTIIYSSTSYVSHDLAGF